MSEPKTVIGYFMATINIRRQRVTIEKIMDGDDEDLIDLLRSIVFIEMNPNHKDISNLVKKMETDLRPVLLTPESPRLGRRRRKLIDRAGYKVVSCAEDDPAIGTIGVKISDTTYFATQPGYESKRTRK